MQVDQSRKGYQTVGIEFDRLCWSRHFADSRDPAPLHQDVSRFGTVDLGTADVQDLLIHSSLPSPASW